MDKDLSREEMSYYNRLFWKWVLAIFGFCMLLILGTGIGLFGALPSFRDLENPKSNLATEVISSDNVVLGTYYVQNRSNVNYNQISPNVINALVATEDIRFFDHSGVDFKRSFSILLYNLMGKKQGASTITQQLALNMFSKEGRSKNILKRFTQKLQELIIAVKLERNYTKEEIITMYLNTVDFGYYNTYGIKSAARTYFNTTPDKLKPDQAALLVGMLRGTSLYSPIRNPERAKLRRNTVLHNMKKAAFIGESEFEIASKKPLALVMNPLAHNEGVATYFRSVLRKDIRTILQEREIRKPDGTPYDLDRDGLKIYTTIDSRLQRYAEEAQTEHLKALQPQFNAQWGGRDPFKGFQLLIDQGIKRSERYHQGIAEGKSEAEIMQGFKKKIKMTVFSWKGNIDTTMTPLDSLKYYKMMLRSSFMAMEPHSGYVRAWVGGANYEYFKYDQVKIGTRQIGSTAKPFTYLAALQKGFSPCFQVPNVPVTIDGWTPKEDRVIPGMLTLKKALANSQNYVTTYLMKEVGPTAVVTLLKKMGITSEVPPYPSICLGTFDASLYDVVGAYAAFVNHGIWTEPNYLLRIEDKNGHVLYEHTPKIVQAIDEQYAYTMVNMLKDVVTEGSASRLRYKYGLKQPMGGKTGTTQNNSDGWYIGITPQLVAGSWMGCEDRAIHFSATVQGQGANSALPVYAYFMKRVYADPTMSQYAKGDFEPPKNGIDITTDCDSYHQATPAP